MPKITSQKIHRIHISLFEREYEQISKLADQNHTSISEILRTCVRLLTNSQLGNDEVIKIPQAPINLEF